MTSGFCSHLCIFIYPIFFCSYTLQGLINLGIPLLILGKDNYISADIEYQLLDKPLGLFKIINLTQNICLS